MKKQIRITDWKLSVCPNSRVVRENYDFRTPSDVENSGLEIIPASVPGNFELDLMNAGKLTRDIFFGTNILKLQDLECMHLWYFTEFETEPVSAVDGPDVFLNFEGIDTVSEIYLNGVLLGTAENMLIPHVFPLNKVKSGIHKLLVHIIPVSVYARRFDLQTKAWAMKYTQDSLLVRKPAAMYGWDIMPRAISGGLWRPVSVEYRPRERIRDFYLSTLHLNTGGPTNSAELLLKLSVDTSADDLRDLTVTVRGTHQGPDGKPDSSFGGSATIFSVNQVLSFRVENAVLWWPARYGEPALYDVEITLSRTKYENGERLFNVPGETLDTVTFRHGIRTVELERTSLAGRNGKFFFRVNDRKIFVLGTNWVPADTFPSRIDSYTVRGLELALDAGCNMIRCWGGGPYPGDVLFDYCDEHGIMVWQDFSMACGLYPDDERTMALIREEGISVVKSLRNHASLVLWSGDNENDIFATFRGGSVNGRPINRRDPNLNKLTREVLAEVTDRYDGFRPYIPSSPYIDEEVFRTAGLPAEDHLWGPRDYFKGEYYYKNSVAHFASEIGYHGCPSPASLKKFVSAESLGNRGDGRICTDPEWLVHSASMETSPDAPFAYRVPLMTRQVEQLFGTASTDLETYALESQISQAEAMKFFIEHFRIGKWYRSGIIWWNIIDGWPQISDAVVDWYGVKKLAYEYIKRSQRMFCLMCDEPDSDGNIALFSVNDYASPIEFEYSLRNALTGETVLSGKSVSSADSSEKVVSTGGNMPAFCVIEWRGSSKNGSIEARELCGRNHFIRNLENGVDLDSYRRFMEFAGLSESLYGFTKY